MLSPQLPRSAAGPAEQLFRSPIRTSPTPTVTPTPDGLFRSILGTPQYVASYRQHLPLVRRDFTPTPTPTPTPIIYGWKGIGDAGEIPGANWSNGFWGLNPSWNYDWDCPEVLDAATAAEQMALAMEDPYYVPMIWCPNDADSRRITPERAANNARDHPGRIWLIFNEPDIVYDGDNCGTYINQKYPDENYYGGSNYDGLGKYLAQQYIRYYDAITMADSTARLFPFGGARPPGAGGNNGTFARAVWNGFTSYLANPVEEPNPAPRPLHGIAIHAYPIPQSTGCWIEDFACLRQALVSTHTFYQNVNPGVTAQKSIWITEVGNLQPGGMPPGSWQGRQAKQAYTREVLTQPLLTWFTANAVPGGSVPYFNGLAWFSTHDCRPRGDGSIKDFTASDLLDIGLVDCPLQQQPTVQQLTVIGQTWAAAECDLCPCPGPDCE